MGKSCGLGKVRATPILKIYRDILKQAFLITLGGKVIMGLAVFDQMASQFTLSQQCITADNNAFNVEISQQRSGYFYFIGLLEFIASIYRDEADFFWA